MNLTLHHFKKEARHLLPRWWPWLALVFLQLAVNQEWIAPMGGGPVHTDWPVLLLYAVWGGALLLAASCAPEDSPASDRRFIGTRPLPRGSYWRARALVVATMIVLPLVLAEGLHLALLRRPAGEIMLDMAGRGVLSVAVVGWLLPMSALWVRGEWFAGLGVLFLTDVIMENVGPMVARQLHLELYPSVRQTTDSQVAGRLLTTFLLVIIAVLHGRFQWPLRRRLLACAVVAMVWCGLTNFWPWAPLQGRGEDQARVDRMASHLQVEMLTQRFYPQWNADYDNLQLSMEYRAQGLEPGISVQLRAQGTQVRQEEQMFRSRMPAGFRTQRGFTGEGPFFMPYAGFKDLLPPGTLLYSSTQIGGRDPQETFLCELLPPYPAVTVPLQFTAGYAVDWWRREISTVEAGDGANIDSGDVRVQIEHVRLNEIAGGAPQQGTVTFDLRVEQRPNVRYKLLLGSPQRHMVWLQSDDDGTIDRRALDTGYHRALRTVSWKNVLTYGDGQDAKVDAGRLNLHVLRLHYLGETTWKWESPAMRMADYATPLYTDLWRPSPLYHGRGPQALRERLATLSRPPPGASKEQVVRYVHDVSAAAVVTSFDIIGNDIHPLLTEALRPLVEDHLDVLLGLPDGAIPYEIRYVLHSLLESKITEADRDYLIDHMLAQSWLIEVVEKHGWLEQARRLKPQLLALPTIQIETESLMLKLGDPDLHLRLIQQLRQWPSHRLFTELWKVPDLRPALQTLSQEMYAQAHHGLYASINEGEKFVIAAAQGNAGAFDTAIRWAALTAEPGMDPIQIEDVLDLSKIPHRDWPKIHTDLRGLSAKDFEYMPAQRAWRRKP